MFLVEACEEKTCLICGHSIDAQILRLRRKLEANPSAPRVIFTERGVGYVFAPPVVHP
jgi:two-component system, OmpR family, response regulator